MQSKLVLNFIKEAHICSLLSGMYGRKKESDLNIEALDGFSHQTHFYLLQLDLL